MRASRILLLALLAAAIHPATVSASDTETSTFRWSAAASIDPAAAIDLATSTLLARNPELSRSRLQPLSVSIIYEPGFDTQPRLSVVLVDTSSIPPGTPVMADVPHYFIKIPPDGGGEPTIESPHGVWEAPTTRAK